jgi:hypothetical protein
LLAVVNAVTAQRRIAAGLNLDARIRVAGDFIVLQRAEAVVEDENSSLLAVVNAVAAEGRIAAGLNLDARIRVAEDLVVFQRAQAAFVDKNSSILAVNAVAAEPGIGTSMYCHACEVCACNIAPLQVEPALADVDGEPFAASHLAEGKIHDPAHTGPKQDHVLARCFENNVSWFAVSDDFYGFINGNPLSVEPGPDQDPMTRPCRLQRSC